MNSAHDNKKMSLLSQQGSAMLLAMVAIFTITATSIHLMNSRESQVKLTDRIITNTDVNRASSIVGAILLSPANCNANFYNVPQVGSLTSLRVCPENFVCRGDTTPTTYLEIGSTSWDSNTTGISNKVRIKNINYAIIEPMAPYQAAKLRVTVTFEQRMESSTRTVVKILDVFAVTGGPGILGCPRNPTETTPY